MKKLLAAFLAMIMVFALGAGAFADDEPNGDIIAAPVNDLSGKTVILHTNDVHGAIEGYACLAAMKSELAARGAEVILVDAGDFSQGTTYVSTTKGADAVTMMNAVGYNVVTLGNHEFDYHYTKLVENMKKATFKVICSDVFYTNGQPLFDPSFTYVTASGVKIGFVGLVTPEAQTKTNPALIQDLKFVTSDIFSCAQAQIDALNGTDVVIALSHLGVDASSKPYTSYDLWNNTTGLDFIIDGHSHTVMTKGSNNEPIQSTGTAFANIGMIVIDDATREIESNELIAVGPETAKDEAVAAAAKVIVDRVNSEYGIKFAESTVSLNGAKAPNGNRDSETNNGDLIADALAWQVLQNKDGLTVDADHVIAITNGGGIRAAINPGDVTKKDINTVLPFGNTVAVVYISGSALLETLEASTYCTPSPIGGFPQVSGITFSINTTKNYDANAETYPGSTYYGPASINRVTINSINGKAFDADATYAVVTNNFCAAGGDTYYAFTSALSQFDTGIPLDEAVMAYVTEELNGIIGEKYSAPQGRITIKANPFADVPNNAFYKDAVLWASDNGIATGKTDTSFDPYAPISREEAMTFIYRYAKTLDQGFKDAWAFLLNFEDRADIDDWADEAMHFGVMRQILLGDGEGHLNPNSLATRQDVITMLYRYIKNVNNGGFADGSDYAIYLPFKDVASISDYATESVMWCYMKGIARGSDDNFAPLGTCTRAEFLTFLYRYAIAD